MQAGAAGGSTSWMERVEYAFQPIVDIHTGVVYGFEALVRHQERSGYPSKGEMLEAVGAADPRVGVGLTHQGSAVRKFSAQLKRRSARLFFNLEPNGLAGINDPCAETLRLLEENSLSPGSICFQLSLKSSPPMETLSGAIKRFQKYGFKVALDNFGAGHLGVDSLYHCEPDFIKLDRFFVDGIDRDTRKPFIVSRIIEVSRRLGVRVIAVGLETKGEYQVCLDIGCELIQGHLVQPPEPGRGFFKAKYSRIHLLHQTVSDP